MEYHQYLKRALGYIRLNALNEEDYEELRERFTKINQAGPKNIDTMNWLYYKSDQIIFNYYFEKGKKYRSLYRKNDLDDDAICYYRKLKQKYVYIYKRLLESEAAFKKLAGPYTETVSFDGEKGLSDDVLNVFEEAKSQALMCIIAVKSRPHEKLMFCYKNFVDGWTSKDILLKLRKKFLDRILIDFVNAYSENSGLPSAAVLIHFYPLEDYLNNTNTYNTKLNSYFARVNMGEFLRSREKRFFVNQLVKSRVKIIDKWCERIKSKVIYNLFI